MAAARLKRALRYAGTLPFRLLSEAQRRWVLQFALDAACARAPTAALSELLRLEDQLAQRLNEAAIRYDGGVHVKHRLTRYHDFFVDRVRPGERVADIGCGYGAVAYSLAARAGADVVAIDLNSDYITQARRQFVHPHLQFVLGDALTDLPKAHCDVVVLSNVLEHIEERVPFLCQLRQRLAPERVLIRVPMIDRDWRVPLRRELGLPYFSDATHFTEYTRDSFEREMQAAALTIRHLQVNWGEIWAEVAWDA